MSRAEYLSELEKLLSDISSDEKQDALGYYYDYLDVDDVEDLEERMRSLGTPEELAAKIKLASSDTSVIDGEFTETGYSDSIDDTRDVPDKYTQVAESDNAVGDNGEPKYTIFGVKITKRTYSVDSTVFTDCSGNILHIQGNRKRHNKDRQICNGFGNKCNGYI